MKIAVPPTLCGFIALGMWSTMFLLLAWTGNIPPFLLGAISFGIGFLSVTAGQLVLRDDFSAAYKRPLKDYLYGMWGIGGYTALTYFAFKNAPAFEVAIINYLWPILLALMIAHFDRAPLSKLQLFGLFLGFCGTVLLFNPPAGHPFFEHITVGHFVAVIAAVIWASYSTFARTKTYPFGFIAPVLLCSALICLSIHLATEETDGPKHFGAWAAIIVLGFFRISYAFWEYGLKHGDRQLIVSFSNLIPLFSTFLLILGGFGPETTSIALAAVFVLSGCLLVNHRRLAALKERLS